MVEQQVNEKVAVANLQLVFFSYEQKFLTTFENDVFHLSYKSTLQIALTMWVW
jgi:hypothetical protein